MMIPEHLEGKELHEYLFKNKKSIVKQKKKMFQKSGAIVSGRPHVVTNFKGASNKSIEGSTAVEDAGDSDVIRVKVIANTSMWYDHDSDVLFPNCWSKSISENKEVIPHVHDHIYSLDGKIGEVVDIYSQDIPLVELGIDSSGVANCLVFVSDVKKSYNPKIFEMYKEGKINQHSIGLIYVNIELAINDKDYENEYKLYQSYIDDIINKEDVEENGFFWAVREIKLLENSCVVRGSNYLSNTLDNDYKSADNNEEPEPIKPTLDDEKSHLEGIVKSFNLNLSL